MKLEIAVSAITGFKAVLTAKADELIISVAEPAEAEADNNKLFILVKKSKTVFNVFTLLNVNGIIVYIINKYNAHIVKAKGKFFVYCDPVSKISVN